MSFKLYISSQAREDIRRNADWWADHYSLEKAIEWSSIVYDQLDTIGDPHFLHSLSRENEKLSFEVREKLIGLGVRPRFRAMFTIQNEDVIVITIRSAEQDELPDDEMILA